MIGHGSDKNVQTSNVIYFQRGSSPSPSTGSSSTTGTDLSSLLSLSRLSSLSSQRSLSSWLSSPIQTSTFCRSRSITDFSSLDRWSTITATIGQLLLLEGMSPSCWPFLKIFPQLDLRSCRLRFSNHAKAS